MSNLSDLIRVYLSQKTVDGFFTEQDIDLALNEFCKMTPFQNISKEEKLATRAELLSTISIRLDKGILLENYKTKHQPWFLNRKKELAMNYWNDYRKYLLTQKHFAPQVVNRMDKVLDELTDLLGDPIVDGCYARKGLVIGDVQSGKTANYTGLICKATDAGYKVIVLLAGITDNLREQTQKRLDEGFLGVPSDWRIQHKENKSQTPYIGVGLFGSNHIRPMVLTSSISDFTTEAAQNLSFTLDNINGPVLFVIKKNVHVLKQLNNWLEHFNRKGNDGKINQSLLLIDDEADNASINTRDNEDPTATNREIRKLFNVFSHSSYVGYTATPYANIFIDPETDEEMEHADLFPSDYIYCLDIPSNYIGARNIFGDEESVAAKMLVTIDETVGKKDSIGYLLPTNHKKEGEFKGLPTDLKEAINAFLLANVIEDLEGNLLKNHRTMLINISRFRIKHQQISDAVLDYVQQIQRDCQNYCTLDVVKALNNSSLHSLYVTFKKIYSECPLQWEKIQKRLYQSIASITVKTINSQSEEKLNYDSYPDGLRVIVVGGFTLSRGLTLEGLVTSYFYRNSKMYDTLMQMGRWFGYRNKYVHLCRIWMSAESQNWYRTISAATDELRRDIQKYKDTGLTPLDFGLRVRSDINSLLVTARNKMKHTQIERKISLNEEYIETPRLISNVTTNQQNIKAVRDLVENLFQNNYQLQRQADKYGFINVDKEYILNLLRAIIISPSNINFDLKSILPFIMAHYKGNELEKWDIVFASGSSTLTQDFGHNIIYNLSTRKYSLENDGKIIKMSGGSARLGSTSDVKFGLTNEQIKHVERQFTKNSSTKGFFRLQRNPLLVIYMIELGMREGSQEETEQDVILKQNQPYIGFGIGFPTLSDIRTQATRYVLNPVAIRQQEGMDDEDGEEE